MGEASGLLLAIVGGLFILFGLSIFIGGLASRYNPDTAPEDIQFQSTFLATSNLTEAMANTTQSEEVSSGEFFGIPTAVSINILTASKLIFGITDIMQSLIDNAFTNGILAPVAWAKSYILLIIGIVILFTFISLIMRYNA